MHSLTTAPSPDATEKPHARSRRLHFLRHGGRARALLALLAAALVLTGPPVFPTGAAALMPRPDGLAIPAAARATIAGHAYRLVAADGGVFSLGWYSHAGSMAGQGAGSIVGMAVTRSGFGYWLVNGTGGVFALGDAHYHGALADAGVSAAVVGMAATPSNNGYWLVSREGGVFAFGDAPYLGTPADLGVTATVVGIASTPSGLGYWLLARDGGVFAFGDAPYLGGLTDAGVTTTVVGMAPTPSGLGYWVVARDGGVFAFGDAQYLGALTDAGVRAIAAGIASTPSGLGYWVAARDGGVFAFGDATYFGSLGGRQIGAPIVGMTGGRGWSEPMAADTLEAALPPVRPATPPPPPPAAPAPPPLPAAAAKPARGDNAEVGGRVGYDISWPQCDREYPARPFAFGIVGITGGRAFRHNRCLADQWRWAKAGGAAAGYVNVNFPRTLDELARGATGPQPDCNGDMPCIAYNFGFNGVQDALAYAHQQRVNLPFVWLDIETMNYWSPDRPLNAVVVRGAIDAVRQSGKEPGIYSTPFQWNRIAGDFAAGVPMWIAGAPNLEAASGWCSRSFAGGPVVIVQTLPIVFDENYTCPGNGPMKRYFAR